MEHPLRSSTKMVNLAPRSTILVNLNLVYLEDLGNFGGVELSLVNLELVNLCQTGPYKYKYW
jgi:hypothetical protein